MRADRVDWVISHFFQIRVVSQKWVIRAIHLIRVGRFTCGGEVGSVIATGRSEGDSNRSTCRVDIRAGYARPVHLTALSRRIAADWRTAFCQALLFLFFKANA